MRVVRIAVLVLLFLGRSAVAGDMLTPARLVKEADAVAVVDNPLNSSRAVRRFIGSEPTMPVTLSSPLCVPDRDMLKRWQKNSPKHAGAPTWAKTLSIGHIDQVVFLKANKGVLVPFCETEVMSARAFSTHPDYRAYLAEVESLVRGAAPVAADIAVEAAVEAAVAPPLPVVVDKGCW